MKDKTIRVKGQWVKITRREAKGFIFARGYEGEFQAHDIEEFPKEYMPTWKAAIAHAEQMIKDYQ